MIIRNLFFTVLIMTGSSATAMITMAKSQRLEQQRQLQQGLEAKREKERNKLYPEIKDEIIAEASLTNYCSEEQIAYFTGKYASGATGDVAIARGDHPGELEECYAQTLKRYALQGRFPPEINFSALVDAADEVCYRKFDTPEQAAKAQRLADETAKRNIRYDELQERIKNLGKGSRTNATIPAKKIPSVKTQWEPRYTPASNTAEKQKRYRFGDEIE